MLWYSTQIHHLIAQPTSASSTGIMNVKRWSSTTTVFWLSNEDPSHPLFTLPLVDGVLNRQDITNAWRRSLQESGMKNTTTFWVTWGQECVFHYSEVLWLLSEVSEGKKQATAKLFASIAFNLIPDALGYESFWRRYPWLNFLPLLYWPFHSSFLYFKINMYNKSFLFSFNHCCTSFYHLLLSKNGVFEAHLLL